MQQVLNSPNQHVGFARIGEERQPLIVVDELVADPHALIVSAQQGEGFSQQNSDFYPGVRKVLHDTYPEFICDVITTSVLPRLNEFKQHFVSSGLCAFSIANQSPSTLLPIQRIPHFDTSDPTQWAVVHFLCDASFGGTGFFRHRHSGFETITQDRKRQYERILEDEALLKGLPPEQYLNGDSALFEMHHQVEAKFNRALIYPSNLLHSGLVRRWQPGAIDSTRLTINTCVQFNK